MKTCPLCPRPLLGKRRHCPICQAKRIALRRGHTAKPGCHPNSRKNLMRGGHSKDPAVRQKVAQIAGKARAEKSITQMEAAILRKFGKNGLRCFKQGKRVGYQAAYYRWKTWAMKAWAERKQAA